MRRSPDRADVATRPQVGASEHDCSELAVRAATLRGGHNRWRARPRQDAYGVVDDASDWVLFGVADGLGSCRLSHRGADAALLAALPALGDALGVGDPAAADRAVAAADDATAAAAASSGADARDVATTLTVAAVARSIGRFGTRTCVVVSVGDSPALLLRDGPEPWALLTPETDGPGNVVHTYVPGQVCGAVSTCVRLGAGEVLVLATDGFAVPLADRTNGLAAELRRRWLPGPRPLIPFIADLTFEGHLDDRTVVAVWNRPGVGRG